MKSQPRDKAACPTQLQIAFIVVSVFALPRAARGRRAALRELLHGQHGQGAVHARGVQCTNNI